MANTVFKLRRSSVAGKVPNTATLSIGELGINLTDRKLFSSDGTNVWETGANLSSLAVSNATTTYLSVNSTIIALSNVGLSVNGSVGTSGQYLTSNGTGTYWSSPGAASINTAASYTWTNTHSFTNTVTFSAISANGGLGSAGQVLTSNGSATYWSTVTGGGGGFTNGQSISVNNFVMTGAFTANSSNGSLGQVLTTNGTGVYWSTVSGGGGSSGSVAEIRQQYTGTGACTTFTVSGGYTRNALSVYLNGVMMRNGTEVDITNGSTVVFTTAPANGTLIDVVGRGASFSNNVSTTVSQQFTANGSANSFTISGGYVPNEIMVWVNGVKQVPGVDVLVASGSTINFPSPVPNNYIVDVFGYATAVLTSSVRQSNTGDGVTNTFIINGNYVPNQIDVYMNGVKIGPSVANVSSGTSVVFTSAPPSGAELQFVALTPSNFYTLDTQTAYIWSNTQTFANLVMSSSAGINANGSYGANGQVLTSNGTSVYWSNATAKIDQLFTGTGACTTFTVTGGYVPSQLDVYVTGVKQVPGTDVTISTGNTIVFAVAPPNNAVIEAVGWIPVTYTYANTTATYNWTGVHTFANAVNFTNTATINSKSISTVNKSIALSLLFGG